MFGNFWGYFLNGPFSDKSAVAAFRLTFIGNLATLIPTSGHTDTNCNIILVVYLST